MARISDHLVSYYSMSHMVRCTGPQGHWKSLYKSKSGDSKALGIIWASTCLILIYELITMTHRGMMTCIFPIGVWTSIWRIYDKSCRRLWASWWVQGCKQRLGLGHDRGLLLAWWASVSTPICGDRSLADHTLKFCSSEQGLKPAFGTAWNYHHPKLHGLGDGDESPEQGLFAVPAGCKLPWGTSSQGHGSMPITRWGKGTGGSLVLTMSLVGFSLAFKFLIINKVTQNLTQYFVSLCSSCGGRANRIEFSRTAPNQ